MTTYVKQPWANNSTGISYDKLQHIEDGIEAIDTCATADVSESYIASGTVYQNTSGQTKLIHCPVHLRGTSTITAYIGAMSSPSSEVAQAANQNTYSMNICYHILTFLVPPDYYYKVVLTGDYAGFIQKNGQNSYCSMTLV